MFNIGIIDDNKAHIKNICKCLENSEYYSSFDIYRYYDVSKLLEASQNIKFNLLFVDIALETHDGIDIVNNYFTDTPIVYVTSYYNKMERAFGRNVYKYVLKDKLNEFFTNDFSNLMNQLLYSQITIKEKDDLYVYDINDIIYIQYLKRNISIYTKDNHKHVIKRMSLASFIEPYQAHFIAASRDIYVNWKYIKKIKNKNKIVLNNQDETEIMIAKNRVSRFLNEYIDKTEKQWL